MGIKEEKREVKIFSIIVVVMVSVGGILTNFSMALGFVIMFSSIIVGPIVLHLMRKKRLEKQKRLINDNKTRIKTAIGKLTSENNWVNINDLAGIKREKNPSIKLKQFDFEGVYIIKNNETNKCYVGQSINVLKRIEQHFIGEGNPNVFIDFHKGYTFSVNAIPLAGSGYDNLRHLESDTILAFNSYEDGYNRTR